MVERKTDNKTGGLRERNASLRHIFFSRKNWWSAITDIDIGVWLTSQEPRCCYIARAAVRLCLNRCRTSRPTTHMKIAAEKT